MSRQGHKALPKPSQRCLKWAHHIDGSKMKNKWTKKSDDALDVEHMIAIGCNPCSYTPKCVLMNPGRKPLKWERKGARVPLKTQESRNEAGWPPFRERVKILNPLDR